MTLKLDVSLDVSNLVNWDLIPAAALRNGIKAASSTYMERQRSLMSKGRDVHGTPFKAYDPPASVRNSYADRKTRAGRMGKNFWLRLSGQMMRSQTAKLKTRKNFAQVKHAFEGMLAPVKFTSPKRKRKGQASDSLTVNLGHGEQTPASFIAWQNHKRRPFIGMSRKTQSLVWRAFGKVIKHS